MRNSRVIFTTLIFCLMNLAIADDSSFDGEHLPASLLFLNKSSSHHVAIVEKSAHKLHLFEARESKPHYLKSFTIATGKKAGDKLFQGDHRTPEGIYKFTQFIPKAELLERYGEETGQIYGAGAFVMNYPNVIDSRNGKTGGGIWLHSTNDDTRISKGLDSRGCVVAVDKDLINISHYIELQNTPIVIVHDLKLLREETWNKNRDELFTTVKEWSEAWQAEDIDAYTNFYHPTEFKDPYRGGFQNFKNYKRSVFRAPGKPTVAIKSLSILSLDEYSVVSFVQDYKSNTIQDVGRKTLYLKKDEFYQWKIVAEIWQKIPEEERNRVAFTPSNRFFQMGASEESGQAN